MREIGSISILSGTDDKWELKDIDLFPDNEVKVFDHNDRLIYTKKGYRNDWGSCTLIEGTYFYIIDYGDGRAIKRGIISVVK